VLSPALKVTDAGHTISELRVDFTATVAASADVLRESVMSNVVAVPKISVLKVVLCTNDTSQLLTGEYVGIWCSTLHAVIDIKHRIRIL
jgi:hypothetical protein